MIALPSDTEAVSSFRESVGQVRPGEEWLENRERPRLGAC